MKAKSKALPTGLTDPDLMVWWCSECCQIRPIAELNEPCHDGLQRIKQRSALLRRQAFQKGLERAAQVCDEHFDDCNEKPEGESVRAEMEREQAQVVAGMLSMRIRALKGAR